MCKHTDQQKRLNDLTPAFCQTPLGVEFDKISAEFPALPRDIKISLAQYEVDVANYNIEFAPEGSALAGHRNSPTHPEIWLPAKFKG